MRVLVIGAYGFIGSAVVARLVADGHEVVGAGRRIKAARERR
ncbi:MAG TPA: NAD-dependent epimerase/dehydratase family protein, partial [Xanthobacteraceae bacterium]|nr:NAD-dependent epimerase/dehydratase family protein [Xanthobacteraceae bacterium]